MFVNVVNLSLVYRAGGGATSRCSSGDASREMCIATWLAGPGLDVRHTLLYVQFGSDKTNENMVRLSMKNVQGQYG